MSSNEKHVFDINPGDVWGDPNDNATFVLIDDEYEVDDNFVFYYKFGEDKKFFMPRDKFEFNANVKRFVCISRGHEGGSK